MKRPALFIPFVLALALLPAGRLFAKPAPNSAEAFVLRQLEEAGLEVGFNEEGDRVVQLGVAGKPLSPDLRELTCGPPDGYLMKKRKLGAPPEDPRKHFTSFRDRLFRVAEFKAKAEILRFLTTTISVSAETIQSYSDGTAVKDTMTTTEIFSHLRLDGFLVLSTAESWNDGVYQVAVAVGWSPKSEALVAGSKSTDASIAPPPGENSPEWKKWAETQDFSLRLGAYSFEDSAGVLRHVGIAAADVDGLSGKALRNAKQLAFTMAKANLCYALYGDSETRIFVRSRLKETFDGTRSSFEVEESSIETIFQKCRAIHVFADEVYTASVVHPLTGRTMFVSVVGIEPGRFQVQRRP